MQPFKTEAACAQSQLSWCMTLGDSIDKLNDDGCLQVILLLTEHSWYKDLRKFVNALLVQLGTATTADSLAKIYDSIQQISKNPKFSINQNPPSTEAAHAHTALEQLNDTNCDSNGKDVKSKPKPSFPLLHLPTDLIRKTSFYLNEKDIVKFETCCRSFYQMINNSLYLNQSNNFKTFELTNNRLIRMNRLQNSCFKFCKAQTLIIELSPDKNPSTIEYMGKIWHRIWHVEQNISGLGTWLPSLFRSIKSLNVHGNSVFILNQLPLNILFDSRVSQLENIEIDHRGTKKSGTITNLMNEFETKYLQLKQEFENQGKQLQKLKHVVHVYPHSNPHVKFPRCIETQCLNLCITRSLGHDGAGLGSGLFHQVNSLTFEGGFIKKNHFFNRYRSQLISQCHINTLKLTNCGRGKRDCFDICLDKKIIETLNLQYNLQNLMIHIDAWSSDGWSVIETVFTKKYYHNLKRVNIMASFTQKDRAKRCGGIKKFFTLLKKHKRLLKHQFQELNIGLMIPVGGGNVRHGLKSFHVFQWNKQIDTNYLNYLQTNEHECLESMKYCCGNEKKYYELKTQF